jgi:ABC-type transporter Mla subunit MlaD
VPLRIHDEGLSRRVGGVVLLVTAAVIVYVIGFRDRFPQQGIDVRVYFAQSTGMSEGAAVRIAGRDIGVVTSISILPRSRCGSGHPLDGTGGVVVVARIRHEWAEQIPVTSVFFVGSKSLLAPRYLEIAAPDDPAPARPLAEGDELRGVDPPDLDRVLQRVWNNLEDVDAFMESINPASAALKLRIAQLRFTLGTVLPDVDLSVWPGTRSRRSIRSCGRPTCCSRRSTA